MLPGQVKQTLMAEDVAQLVWACKLTQNIELFQQFIGTSIVVYLLTSNR